MIANARRGCKSISWYFTLHNEKPLVFSVTIPPQITQLFLCGVLALFAVALGRFTGFWQRLPPLCKERCHEIAWSDVGLLFAVFLVVQLLFFPLLWSLAALFFDATAKRWYFLAAMPVTTAAVMAAYLLRPVRVKLAIWGTSPAFSHNLAIGATTWLISFPCVAFTGALIRFLLSFIPPLHQVEQLAVTQLKAAQDDPLIFLLSTLGIVTLIPLLEELLFRGALQGALKNFLSPYYAIAATSVVFALFHFSPSQGASNIELLLALFVLSCFLGYLRERQHSLWASIALHSTFNAISIVMILFEQGSGGLPSV